VEIGCFRAYQNDHAEKILQTYKQQTGSAIIPGDKFQEFGLHAHKYYKLEHTFFKSGLDTTLLERLWNEYWVHTLASSPLLSNQDIICKSVINIADKLVQIHAGKPTQRGIFSNDEPKVIEEEKFAPLAAESSKVAVDVSQGIFVEALKKFMFACQPTEHAICCKSEADAEMAEESKE
jgi:COP9 signalosome complex subunit 5